MLARVALSLLKPGVFPGFNADMNRPDASHAGAKFEWRVRVSREVPSAHSGRTQEIAVIPGMAPQGIAVFLTRFPQLPELVLPMRRLLPIRVEFATTRLSTQHLRTAYDLVTPIARRVVRASNEDMASDHGAPRRSRDRLRRKVST
jgi:hypothetical protein